MHASRLQAEARVSRLGQWMGWCLAKGKRVSQLELQRPARTQAALAQSLDGRQAVTASSDGVLASARALNGQMVEPQAVLFEITDPKRALIEARVSDPAQAAQIVAAHVQGVPDLSLKLVGAARVMQDGAVPVSFRANMAASGVPSASALLAIGQP